MTREPVCIAFAGSRRLAIGTRAEVTVAATRERARKPEVRILAFDLDSSRPVELDLRGEPQAMTTRKPEPAPAPARKPGRPRLGVVAREVTLLPRHWQWLGEQPGGASAALRRLVEMAKRGEGPGERARQAGESLYRFMLAMAGDRAGYEEALRAFYRGERERFAHCIAGWPRDIREHAGHLASMAWDEQEPVR